MNHGDTENTEVFDVLVACLESRNATPRPGLSEDQIRSLETKLNLSVPEQVCEYLRLLNGTGRENIDDDFIAFWAIEEWISLVEVVPNCEALLGSSEHWIVFGDHSIGIVYFAVNFVTNTTVSITPSYGDDSAHLDERFDSLALFFEAYVKDGLMGLL